MAADQLRDQFQTTLGSAYTLDRELGGGGMSRVFVAREALAYLFAGRPDSALALAERGVRDDPGNPAGRAHLALAYAANGRWDDVERMRTEVARNPSSDPSGMDAALIALAMGDHAPLLHVLQTPAGRKAWSFRYYSLGCSPLLDPLANEPAYRAMLAQQHLGRCEGSSPWPIKPRPR